MASYRSYVFLTLVSSVSCVRALGPAGGDLYNNIFSDLGPLLSLFGDQVTMQFLSQALGLADCIVVAMAPLGILTIIVSAIRVGGQQWLKAIIGRASENLSTAEKDLLSSTSDETCELWNGKNVVRCQGSAAIREFILLFPKDKSLHGSLDLEIMDIKKVTVDQQILIEKELSRWNRLQKFSRDLGSVILNILGIKKGKADTETPESIAERGQSDSSLKNKDSPVKEEETDPSSSIRLIYEKTSSPNMFLNRHNSVNRREIYLVAVLSVFIQLGVLVFYAVMTYHPHFRLRFQKSGNSSHEYPIYLTVVGTVMLSIGLLVCAHVIQRKTEERCYITPKNQNVQIIWLQQEKSVNDQKFESYATYMCDQRPAIVTSRRRIHKYKRHLFGKDQELGEEHLGGKLHTETLLGTTIGVTGYIMQLIGLRGMHWTAALVQFIATIVMTALRTFLRREALQGLGSQPLRSKFELDWLSLSLVNYLSAEWFTVVNQNAKRNEVSKNPAVEEKPWTIINGISDDRGESYKALTLGKTECNEANAMIEEHDDGTDSSTSLASPSTLTSSRKASWTTGTQSAVGSKSQISKTTTRATEIIPASLIKAQKAMNIRGKLSEITQWRSPASAWSLSMSRAIEEVMDILFPQDHTCSKKFTWHIDVMHDGEWSDVKLELERGGHGGGWKTDMNRISAALSLWLYSVEGRKKPNLTQNYPDAKEDDDDPRQHPGLRLLGPTSKEFLPELIAYLEWWCPEGLSRILAVEKVVIPDDPDFQQKHANERMTNYLEIENYRVVGCRLSHVAPMDEHSYAIKTKWAWCYAGGRNQDQEYYPELLLPYKSTLQLRQRNKAMKNVSLAIKSYDSLETLYAKDLLFSFMCAAAKALEKPLHGETTIKRSTVIEGPSAWKYYKLWNTSMDRLAQVLERNGFGTTSEAYSGIIVPALAMAGKLPDSIPLLRLGLEAANERKKARDWQHMIELYERLWDHTKAFEYSKSHIYTKALAAIMSLEMGLENEMKLRRLEGREMWQLEEVQKSMKSMLDSSRRNSHSLLESLTTLSKIQQLPWVSDQLEGKLGNDENSFSDETPFNDEKLFKEEEEEEEEEEKSISLDESNDLPHGLQRHDVEDLKLNRLHLLTMDPDLEESRAREIISGLPEEMAREQDAFDWTPLHYATAVGKAWVVSRILAMEEAVDTNAQDLQGWTPLHYACLYNRKDVVTDLLNNGGANATVQGVDGVTPMHCAVKSGNLELVTMIQKQSPGGKYPKLLDLNERSPVHWAAIGGNVGILKAMKGRFKAKDAEGWTPLHLATMYQRQEIIKTLLGDLIVPKESTDKKGRTPLILAAEWGKFEAAKALIENGVKIDAKGESDRAAIYHAVLNENIDIVGLLLDHGADIIAGSTTKKNMIYTAASRCSLEMMKLLLERKPEAVNDVDTRLNYSPLAAAADAGRPDMIKLLISSGAVMSITDKESNNPLHIAVNSDNSEDLVETVKVLIDAHVDTTARSDGGKTPLDVAKDKLLALEKRKPADLEDEDKDFIKALKVVEILTGLAEQQDYPNTRTEKLATIEE